MGQSEPDRAVTLEAAPDREGDLVGRCDCGWRTAPLPSGREVGDAWARHVDEAHGDTRVA